MLHEGGCIAFEIRLAIKKLRRFDALDAKVQFVLIGFLPHLALHLERSTLRHSNGYASAVDPSTYFATWTGNSDPFMQHAG